MRRARELGVAGLIVVAGLAGARPIAGQVVDYRLSTSYATGSYIFTGRTWSAAMFHGVSARFGAVSFSASLPVVAQNNTALSYVAGVILPTGGPDGAAVAARRKGAAIPMGPGMPGGRRAGSVGPAFAVAPADSLTVAEPSGTAVHIGDPFLSAMADVFRGQGLVRSITVQAFAKAPVASVASGVSTGRWDYGAGAGLAFGAGRMFWFGDLSYWVLGDMPALELIDNVAYGAGLGRSTADGRWSMMGSVSGSSVVLRNVAAPASAGVNIAYAPVPAHAFTFGLNFGLSESAAQLSASLGWRVRLFGTP